MFILLYRYLKRKNGERKAGGQPEAQAQTRAPSPVNASAPSLSDQAVPQLGEGATSSTKSQVLYSVLLMVALVIPVFLETLDYTGKLISTGALSY